MDKKYSFLELFVSFKVDETLLEQGADAFWSFSLQNYENDINLDPNFLDRD